MFVVKNDRQATQRTAILNVLVNYTFYMMSSDVVQKVLDDLLIEINDGACAWAFAPAEREDKEG